MPHLMELKDGKITTVFCLRDVLEAVEEYAGYEARRYLEENLADAEELEKELEAEEKEHGEELERMGDHKRALLNGIKEEAEALEDLLGAPRLDRKKLQKAAENIWRICYGEL